MRFLTENIDPILSGKKVMTSRKKPLCKIGATTNLMVNKDYSKKTGKKIRITDVYPKRLGDFTEEDAHKEGFNNLEEFRNYWATRIVKRIWNPDEVVYVHEFELVSN